MTVSLSATLAVPRSSRDTIMQQAGKPADLFLRPVPQCLRQWVIRMTDVCSLYGFSVGSFPAG